MDYVDWTNLTPNPPILSSFSANWRNINLAHYQVPKFSFSEISNTQNLIIIFLGHQTVDFELIAEGHSQMVSYQETDFTKSYFEMFPAHLPISFHSYSTSKVLEFIKCYIEPTFLAQIAHEFVDPDRVELLLTVKKVDLLICQIVLALRSSLEMDEVGNRLYIDSMATALSAHLLRYYSTNNHRFQNYENGLSKQKLKQSVEYIQEHLGEDLSLSDIATELGMSRYYFCHLFKKSTGLSPHQYLIRQRIEQAKHLLKNTDQNITFVAMECGFANLSHFAKCFRKVTGINPNQFRKS